ncbi:histidine phosphatase family protein [Mycolicibacterium frederiksbergense]|uniref:histidine phosphatase family protein n=1 Tax=Mycolicibacterium frederiksbergense TaxID=117567 RepID=UPI00265C2C37|nr:histidine phosphatase family protein [Mycolicibacterium frederiksbergense]MDO0972574.1 histidine phosphatase family protein [Mycolicibacterium frederiksbergense]
MKDASGPVTARGYWSRLGTLLGIALLSSAMLIGAAIPAAAAELMRVTFVRHGQSAGNASGLIDTSTPGPVLTPTGQTQSEAVVGRLGVRNYDGVYASTMQRTQLTAGPLSKYLHLPIRVLPGVHEIEAGVFEGTPESEAANGYGRYPLAWALQGNRDLRIPGSIDGNEFDARMDGSLQEIYDNGDRNAVVFSHGGAIMFWTMMNATNLTMEQKLDLLRYAPLSNTNYVVVEGNPVDGWKLVDWNGQKFAPEATLAAEVRLQLRTLQRQLSGALTQVVASFATLNPAKVLAAIAASFSDTVVSLAKFAGAVNDKLATQWADRTELSPTVQSVATAALAPAAEQAAPASEAETVAADRQTSKTTVPKDSSASVEPAPKVAAVATESVTEEVTPGTDSETPVEAVAPEAPEIEELEAPVTTTAAKAPRTAKSASSGATTAKKAGNPRAKAGANSAG